MEPVVNIIADGKLAYTGFLSLAAQRLNMDEDALVRAIEDNSELPYPPVYRITGHGTLPVLLPRPKSYKAYWRG